MEHPVAKKRISTRVEIDVAPSEEKTIDSLSFSSFQAAKYLISISTLDRAQVSSFEAMACKKSGDITDSIYSKLGDLLSFETQFLKSGTDIEMRLTNGEAETLRVSFLRFEF